MRAMDPVPLVLLVVLTFSGCTTNGSVSSSGGDALGALQDPRTFYIDESGEITPDGGPVHLFWEWAVPDEEFLRVAYEFRYSIRAGEDEWRFKGPYTLRPVQPPGEDNGYFHTPQDRHGEEPWLAWVRVCSSNGTCPPDMVGDWSLELRAGPGSSARWSFNVTVLYLPLAP